MAQSTARIATPLADFSFKDIDGHPLVSSNYLGKAIVVVIGLNDIEPPFDLAQSRFLGKIAEGAVAIREDLAADRVHVAVENRDAREHAVHIQRPDGHREHG